MIVKTKKHKLETSTYIKLAMKNILIEQWWVFLIFLAIISLSYFSFWFAVGAIVALILYLLFWLIQFAGVTQLEQNKILFEKLSYEIDSRQIMIKVNPKQGMPLTWDNVKKATKTAEAFILIISKAQLIELPYRIFNSDNEKKFVESILKRKGYIKESAPVAAKEKEVIKK
jgi:hypothetical protein